MKRFYFLSVATLVAGIVGLLSLEATAAPKNTIKPIPAPKKGQPTTPPGSTNTTTATGGAGGSGAQGGAGGGAVAVGGNNSGTIINGNNNTINNITKVTNNNISFSPSFGGGGGSGGGSSGGGIAIAGAGGDGFTPGAPGIAVASGPSQTVITTDGSPAIAQGAPGKDNVNAEDAEREEVFTRRFLKVKNDADVPMKVFVQYRGMDDKKWAWLPADPSTAQDSLATTSSPARKSSWNTRTRRCPPAASASGARPNRKPGSITAIRTSGSSRRWINAANTAIWPPR
jgi:hypothetical protein